MLLNEIKDYLQVLHLELDNHILCELENQKKVAIANKDELLANELWCLIHTYKIHEDYLNMFEKLKHGCYEEAWLILDEIDITMGNLRENFGENINYYNLTFINTIIKQYEKMFPDYVFTSRESIIKSEECSIYGSRISLRGGCTHIPGKLYMGELCLKKIVDIEFLGVAIVKNPLDRYAIIKIEGKEYNYQVLEYLMKKLESPFRPWYVEQLTRKKTEYVNLGRNAKCPCNSGKKYKNCCLNTSNEYEPHNRITLLGGEKLKEEKIDYLGRWVDKF